MCESHDKTKLKYELLARVQPSDDKFNYKKQPHSFLCFNPHWNNIYFTFATSTFVEICAQEQNKK